MQLLIVVSVR